MPKLSSRMLLPAIILFVGINLRPSLAAIGPLLDRIQGDTNLSDTTASLLTSLPVMLMGLCLFGTARIKALFGERGGIAVGLGAIALAGLARWQVPTGSMLLITALLCGVGIAMVQALMPMIIRQRAGDRVAGMMGLYSTAIMGGAALASFAAPRISPFYGWSTAIGVWALPAAVGLIIWWLSTRASGKETPLQHAEGSVWRSWRSYLLLAFFGLGTGAYTLVLAWLPPYYTGLGWSAETAGALLATLTLAEVVAGIAVSLGIEHYSDRRPVILLAIGALLAGLLCLCLAPLSLAWPATLFAGLGIGALFPLGLIVAMDHGRSATEAGLIVSFVQGGGYILAAFLPLVAGLLRQHLSDLAPAWWLMAALCLVLGLIAVRLRPGDRLS